MSSLLLRRSTYYYNNIILSSLSLNISKYSFSTNINNNNKVKYLNNDLKRYIIKKNNKLIFQTLDKMNELNIKPNAIILQECKNKYIAKDLYNYFINNNIIPNDSNILKEIFIMFVNCKMNKDAILLYKQYFENKSSSIQLNNFTKDKFIELFINNNDFNMIYKLFKERIQDKSISKYTLPKIFKYIVDNIKLKSIDKSILLQQGKQIQQDIINNNIPFTTITKNQLIDMYGSCNDINTALQIFNEMKESNNIDIISWTTIIKSLCRNKRYKEAIEYYQSMITSGIQPDALTYVSVLSAIINNGCYELGYSIYNNIKHKEYMLNNTLILLKFIEFFGKFGDFEMSMKLFNKIKHISHSTNIPISNECWSTIIYVHGFNGKGKISYDLFKQMTNEYNCKPDKVTVLSLLNGFSHSGMINEAIDLFNKLESHYNIIPNEKHYNSMIDILSRGGQLDKAEEYLNKMPFSDKAKEIGMTALLGGCRKYSDYSRGIRIGESLLKINPNDPGTYILLGNICSDNGKQDESDKYHDLVRDKQLKKEPGITWITINGIINEFHAHESTHKQSKELFDKNMLELDILKNKFGFKSNYINIPSQYKTIQEKEEYLCGHSERYALQYAHQNTPINKAIYATKNLRVCIDCHEWSLYISKLWNREIIVRDANRLHIIKNGICSCNNYW